MAEGFLGRWAKRKEAVRQGKEVPAEPVVADKPLPPPQPSPAGGRGSDVAALAPSPHRGEGGGEGRPAEPPPPPTLEDAQALTKDSDFARFVKPDVSPEVKNAAMKKLFADPHFNVMDGLDTYIDDYGKPDPIPPEMLKSLVSGKFLGLFDEKKEEAKDGAESAAGNAPTGREVADDPAAESVAQSSTRTGQALPPAEDHADPDLRLQQDDAPGPRGPGAGSG
jgi:hypothetical protein